jgi:DNA polymerase
MLNEERLKDLAKQIENCQRCSLYKTATHAVPGEGNPQAKVVFVGEAPGFYEDQQGRPFVGNAGKLLNLLINKVGLKREEVFITNVVKHRPPENRDPLPEEILACRPWLEAHMAIINPKLVVTLGRFSLGYFLPGKKISEAHGETYRSGSLAILPMYHPAAALRNGNVARQLENDFLKNKEILQNPERAFDTDDEDDAQGRLF